MAATVNIHLSNLYVQRCSRAPAGAEVCLFELYPDHPACCVVYKSIEERVPLRIHSSDKLLRQFEVKDNNNLHDRERERGEKKDANSLPIKLAFVYTTADKKEPDFGIKRLKQKLPCRVSVIAPTLWLLIIYCRKQLQLHFRAHKREAKRQNQAQER